MACETACPYDGCVSTTTALAVRRVGSQRDILGECPLWDERTACLWWIDIRAPALRRTVVLASSNARSAIVWNPWPAKTAKLSQMAADDWTKFCCIETANVKSEALTLAPGARHTLELRLQVEAG